MAFYKIADRIFDIKTKYGYTDTLCADYRVEDRLPNYEIEATNEEIMAECEGDSANFAPPYLEALAVYRKIGECLSTEDCFLFHAAVIEYCGKAYAFTAKSGTGKSTHIGLWEKAFGDKVRIINGDKPLIRRKKIGDKNEFIVYGTPWCGKEKKNINTSSTLAGICMLERSKENFALPAGDEAVPFILQQMLFKQDPEYIGALLSFTDALISSVPVYRLGVNMDISAAYTARDAIAAK